MAKRLFAPPDACVTDETVVAKRAVGVPPIPLDDVEAVGRVTDATVKDILLAAVTGALRRYLEANGTVVDDIRGAGPGRPASARPAGAGDAA